MTPAFEALEQGGWLTPLEHTLSDLRFRLMDRAPTGDIVASRAKTWNA